ncbi:MAG: LysR family transcriptional regulator [Egibacteraceae bacterium]
MTLVQLRSLCAVVEDGSVTAAAARLWVSPSAVSAAVMALQRELGVALLAKDGRGVRVTRAGLVFADYARTVLGLLDEAIGAAAAADDPAKGRVRIAAVTTAAEQVLPGALASFRRDQPDVALDLEVAPRDRVWAMLAAHETDVVVAGRPPAGIGGLLRGTRANDLVVVAAPGQTTPVTGERVRAREGDTPNLGSGGARHRPHPLATTWLVREPGSGTRATTTAYLDSLGEEPALLTLGSNGAVVAGAVAGLGVTLVARDAVERQLAAGELVEIDLPGTPLSRPWHLVTAPTAGPTVDLLVAHLLTHGFVVA